MFKDASGALRRACGLALLLGAVVLAGCGSLSYFPPQNLGEVKRGPGNLREAKVLVSMSPQIQLDRAAMKGMVTSGGLAFSAERGYYHDRLLGQIGERLAAQGAQPVTELRDRNDLAAPKLADVIAKERPDYVLRLSQERMGLINSQEASVVWLVELARIRPTGAAEVLFEHHYSVGGAYCLGSKLREFAEPTAMQCLGKQADHIVARLEANNFFNGQAAPAVRQGGLGSVWSEPPQPRVQGGPGSGSSLCLSQAPGVRCQ